MNGTATKEVGLQKVAEFGRGNRVAGPNLVGARGVTINHSTKSIAVTDISTDQIHVYRNNNGVYRQHFEFLSAKSTKDKHLRHPMDIAVISSGRHLVVNNSPYVRVYSTTGQFESRFKTLMPSESYATHVRLQCITTNGNNGMIFIGDHERRLITIHDVNYDLIGNFITDNQPAFLSIDDQNNHLAISDDATGQISIHDTETGQKIIDFRSASGSRGVAFHRPSGSLLVANGYRPSSVYDAHPGSIDQYCCRSGVHITRIIQDLNRPYGLCSTNDNKLVVGDKDIVRVFGIDYP